MAIKFLNTVAVDTNVLYVDADNNRVGIGDSNPNRTLVVSETRTGSTASDAYTAIVKSVQSSGADPNPGTGGLKVQYTSSSSNVHAFGLVAGSSSSDFLTTGPMHFYTNSDLDTVSATGFAMQLDTSQRLTIGSMTASQKLNVAGNVTANRYYGNVSTAYWVDPNDLTQSAYLGGKVRIRQSSSYKSAALEVATETNNGSGEDGVFIKNYFAGTSAVVQNKHPYLSLATSPYPGAISTIYMGASAVPNTQQTKIQYNHSTLDLITYVKGNSGGYVEHVRYGDSSSNTARTKFSGNVGIGVEPTEKLHVNGDFLVNNTSGAANGSVHEIARLINTTSGATSSYMYIGASSGNDWRVGKNILGTSGGSNFGIAKHSGTTLALEIDGSSNVISNVSSRAPIFYDSNNTGYYLDPASSSVALNINGKIAQAKEDWNIDGSHSNAIFQASRSNQTDRGTWPTSYMYAVNFGDRTKGIQLASRYGGSNDLYFRTGTDNPSSENGANTWKNWRQLYHVDYHPEADKWTTARTLTLNGAVSGSVSWDGSANATLTTAVVNDSHDHTRITERSTITFGSGQLQWTDLSGTGGSGTNGNAPGNPFSDWHHHIIMNHANSGGYYVDLAFSFHNDRVHFRRLENGSFGSWREFFHTGHAPTAAEVGAAPSSHNHDDRYYTESESDNRFTSIDNFRHTGTGYYTSTTTSALLTEALGDNAFDSKLSAHKTGWSYAGNGNLTDAGRLTELAGTSWLWWTDNSTDNVQGNVTALCIAPTTGGSAGKMFVYNNQGSSYGPGWREIWTSTSDGSGSGLDADLLDGIQGASFLRSDADDTATGQITITTSGNALTVTSQQSIGAIITGGNNSSDIIQLKKGSNIEAKLDTSGNWHVDADVIAYSTSTASDKKLKTNISTLTDALDKTIKLRGVNFDWIDENKPNNQVGFIAQEVEKVLPEVVKNVETLNKENETHKAVDYAAVVPLLVEAIKEQQKQIDELKSIINGSS